MTESKQDIKMEDDDELRKVKDEVTSAKHGDIRVMPLGAGQDVGGSCILVSFGGKTIMFDCGMHMTRSAADGGQFPDFTKIAPSGPYSNQIDCVIISHFHLDHVGALPFFTERAGYDGPVYMTYPTRALIPTLLEDYRKINTERNINSNRGSNSGTTQKAQYDFFTAKDIEACLKKIIPITTKELVKVCDGLTIRAWPGSHVLGAAMFEVHAGGQCVLYTGDYNMIADRHLGAAYAPPLMRPDLLITECTYCTMIRGSKRARERAFLMKVHQCVARGGKVLVPVFALGRAQEVMLLLDLYWERMGLRVPVYYSKGLVSKANAHYTHYIGWMNETMRSTFTHSAVFEFKHLQPFEKQYAKEPGAMVLFATPGMLHSGISLEVFRQWCGDARNLVILPGYCAPGTIGHQILTGATRVTFDGTSGPAGSADVLCEVTSLSFSAHVDAKGIFGLVNSVQPHTVMLVHGDLEKMGFMKTRIERELNLPCIFPANNTMNVVARTPSVPALLSAALLPSPEDCTSSQPESKRSRFSADDTVGEGEVSEVDVSHSVVLAEGEPHSRRVRILSRAEAEKELCAVRQQIRIGRRVPSNVKHALSNEQFATALDDLSSKLKSAFPNENILKKGAEELTVRNVSIRLFALDRCVFICWPEDDEEFGMAVYKSCSEKYSE